ncbi:MAG: NAD-dependent malic enzyme [Paludibacterium sp.]|uniref:NAD-dependent malic enzyme n=1 Tax=Paludibacterium sp. TaxID=1917523 RepID=UPI0025EE8A34|nr:NAD-dependent malic enzyme [Paludibacterium sp.]MBV8047007.1 NAD-dependent malic enzyme [Paludibacterium sp.]MBV8649079.1 NAD-dependent malic enzyme [Paludibacterium sp.]
MPASSSSSAAHPSAGPLNIETELRQLDVLSNPLLNKGTAFTEAERDELHLHGFLPPSVQTLEEQVARRLEALRALGSDLDRYVMLRDLQDSNETLFYALLTQNIEEMLPLIYTPTVGAGCQRFSHLYRRPRGLFLSYPYKHLIRQILANPMFDAVEAIVVTDGERILGLGDQGAGGMGIPIGKLALYVGCSGLNPRTTLPIMLDVGTDNPDCLADPLYVGWRHQRVRGAEYDAFIEEFVAAVKERWPHVLLQWEDFAKHNASRLLAKYRDDLCTFNDDVQGTAAVATGTLLAAINVTGVPLTEQRIAVLGAGSAGCGIAALIHRALCEAGLSSEEADRRFWLVDRQGLLVEGMPSSVGLENFQQRFVQPAAAVAGWAPERADCISLLDVMRHAKPTVLIGVSGQRGAFSEQVVREMAKHVAQPVIFPLSNPTSNSEARPVDLLAWTAGRAVVGTGSPFEPVERDGRPYKIDQTNNSYIFPGVGLAAVALKIRTIPDSLFMAAAKALAAISPARANPRCNLLPPVSDLRRVSYSVALAVGMRALHEGLLDESMTLDQIEARIRAHVWEPRYPILRHVASA